MPVLSARPRPRHPAHAHTAGEIGGAVCGALSRAGFHRGCAHVEQGTRGPDQDVPGGGAGQATGGPGGFMRDAASRMPGSPLRTSSPQHLVFGTLFSASWRPSRSPGLSESQASAAAVLARDGTPDAVAAAAAAVAASAAATVPVDEPDRAVAPWITAPLAGGAAPPPPSAGGAVAGGR